MDTIESFLSKLLAGLSLKHLSFGGANFLRPCAFVNQTLFSRCRASHRFNFFKFGFDFGDVERQKYLPDGYFIAFGNVKRLHAARDFGGNINGFGLHHAVKRFAARVRAQPKADPEDYDSGCCRGKHQSLFLLCVIHFQ